jgi:hypothetical protein
MFRPQALETIFVLGCACVGLISGSPAGNPIRESVHYAVELVANGPLKALAATADCLNHTPASLRLRALAELVR